MPDTQPDAIEGQSSFGKAALDGSCPRCGQATLFDGWVTFAPACRACGLDFTQFNVGDGPAAFLTLIIGGFVTVLALVLELSVGPPWWVHIIWLPVVVAGTIASLRVAKAMLLTIEYRRRAAEGRIAPPSSSVPPPPLTREPR